MSGPTSNHATAGRASSSSVPGKDDLSLYLHLPFCLSKCTYCDFDSLPLDAAGGLPFARRYLRALEIELDRRAASDEFFDSPVPTIYFGGGTPTVLPPESLASLLQRIHLRFPVANEAEITLEANPGTVHQEGAETLLAAGFNRFSLGVQSLDDDHLRTLGRPHTAEQAVEAADILRRAGCRDLNLDLIYGLPRQSLPQWDDSLQRALDLHPEHISAYALSLEPDTPLARSVEAGSLPAPDDDLAADMYALAAAKLSAAGYHHYEISNFALPGHECRHNRRYWADDEYLGLGCSAHSHRRAVRWNNRPGPQVYIEWLERGRLPVARVEALGAKDRVGEVLMLGLRRAEGVTDDDVFARSGLRPGEVFAKEIEQLAQQGLLLAAEGRLQIPREKWVISNEVLSHFVA